jgi:pimeloyl-ACP methyl ester carboxylesterase
MPLLYFGWERWLSSISHPLPDKSTVNTLANSSSILSGTYYEVSVPPSKKEQYLSADYRLWIPNGISKVRGLLVKQHGCGDPAAATGLAHANDLQWQALALKHQFALLGTKLPTGAGPCENWVLLDGGSERAFLQALNLLALKSNHPELTQVPWVLWGHSGGADWAMQMLRKHSERVIAMVAMRCGGVLVSGKSTILDSEIDRALLQVPVLWAVGEKEPVGWQADECLKLPRQIFLRYRKAGAPWTFALAANTGHESGDTRLLAIPYLDKMIAERLAPKSDRLRRVDSTQGWLGNIVTHEVFPANRYKDNSLKSAWLPNEETADKWQEYVTTGKIAPTSKPNSPINVRATKINPTDALITWNFVPDLENGLASFRIYRNNSLIQTLQGQEADFGDAPEPVNVVLEFRDRQAPANSTYTVAAFNQLGESISRSIQISDRLSK